MPSDHLSTTFAALADPTRRAILARLVSGERSVTELAKPFDMSLPAVSKHLRVLERAGLIVRGREAQWRPCRIEAGPLKEVSDWAERYRFILSKGHGATSYCPVLATAGFFPESKMDDINHLGSAFGMHIDMRKIPGVASATRIPVPFKLASRAFQPQSTRITVGRCTLGTDQLALMAGPCSVESESQAFAIAEAVARSGATILRGGAFKPRTSPYSFQGLGEAGLQILRRAADAFGLARA